MMSNALIIFIKNPVAGYVKTRLARDIGPENALKIYLSLCAHTRAQSLRVECSRYVYYSQSIISEDDWADAQFFKRLQEGSDLGQRMSNAFQEILAAHDKAVIIGSDCPGIDSDILNEAFDALDRNDAVIGPSEDGGYYLLGMNKWHSELFEDINWSTSEVLPSTLQVLRDLGSSVDTLHALEDIDTLDDLKNYPSYLELVSDAR